MTKITTHAPARVCLFGDHQDYLNLPVIACAINLGITLTAEPNDEAVFNIKLPDIQSVRVIDIHDHFEELKKRDYFASALRVLRRVGGIPNVGYDVVVTGDIPINAGLSSSTAVVVAWISFLLKAYCPDKSFSKEQIARLAFESEVIEHQEPGGIMDHYAIALGDIIFLNTDNSSFQSFNHPLNELIISNSGVEKATLETIKNIKFNTYETLKIIQQQDENFILKNADISDFEQYKKHLPEKLIPFFFAAIKNHWITKQALLEFKKNTLDLRRMGELMNQHHKVLKDSLNTTTPLIDNMIHLALDNGAYGAKIVGSGGGGSIAIIAPVSRHEIIINKLILAGAESAISVAVVGRDRIS